MTAIELARKIQAVWDAEREAANTLGPLAWTAAMDRRDEARKALRATVAEILEDRPASLFAEPAPESAEERRRRMDGVAQAERDADARNSRFA